MTASDQDARLELLVLGSGSKGNASVVCDRVSGKGILIDAGICKRDVFAFSEQGGFDLEGLRAIIITHSHSDHVKNLGVITRGLKACGIEVPIYAHRSTLATSKELQKVEGANEIVHFAVDEQIEAGPLRIRVLEASHDTEVSFGFRIECGGDALGFLTDTGMVPQATLEGLRGVRVLALESNHDEKMLRNGPYPRILKERVGSERGHLSNTQAAEVLAELLDETLETVVCLHISENNNTYRLPVETLRAVVEDSGYAAQVVCAYQHRPVFVPPRDGL